MKEDVYMAQKQDDIKISFCLPVYNVKNYISECVQSIYNQDIDNVEIICVDDCSTDGSYEELLRIADMHPDMRIYRNESNRGVSYSRNHAMKEAKGKYIWFVDPDDLLINDAANVYYRIAEENSAEVVLGKYWCFYDGKDIPKLEHGSETLTKANFAEPTSFYQLYPDGRGTCFGVWLGLFRRDFLTENRIMFREQLRMLEDVEFYFEFGVVSTNVLLIDYYGYLYRIRPESAIHSPGKCLRYYEAAKQCMEIRKNYANKIKDVYNDSYRAHMSFINFTMVRTLCFHDDSRTVLSELKYLKAHKYYPHHYKKALDICKYRSRFSILLYNAAQVEPLFWAEHYLYRFVKKLKSPTNKCQDHQR